MSPLKEMFFNRQPVTEAKKAEIVSPQLQAVESSRVEDKEFDELKKGIDWETFWNIVDSIAIRAGVDPKQLNKLKPEDIINAAIAPVSAEDTHTPAGIYYVTSNKVAINKQAIYKAAQKFEVDPKLMTIETICHELAHAISRQEVHFFQDFDSQTMMFKDVAMTRGAYRSSKFETTKNSRGKVVNSKEASFYEMLDEGITETLANEIFQEYVKRTGLAGQQEMEDYSAKYSENETRQYPILVKCVKLLCKKISQKAQVDEVVVWKSFVRGVFRFDTLADQEVKQWFEEFFSPALLDQISRAKKPSELLEIIQKS